MSRSQDTFTTQIDELTQYRGAGTELISVYLPPDRDINSTRSDLQAEHADAQNIKSKQTRQRVQRALTMIDGVLRQYESLPENGLAIFSGVVETATSTEEVLVKLTPPALPIGSYRYHCNNTFLVEPLRALDAPDDLVGLIVVDVGTAEIGVLRGTEIVSLDTIESHVPAKHRQGGQSAARFRRRRQETIAEFYRDVGDAASTHFLSYGDALTSIVVGGPLMTRDAFSDGEYLHHSLRDCVQGVFPVDTVGETGLSQLVARAEDALEQHAYTQQQTVMAAFKHNLRNNTATYGETAVAQAIELGAVETLLVSESESLSTQLVEDAAQYGASVEGIANDFSEGEQLASVFGGVAAILRFPINTTTQPPEN